MTKTKKNIDLVASRAQGWFINSTTRGTIYLGGVGSGKTLTTCRKALIKAVDGRRSCIVSFSYPNLRDTVLFTLKKVVESMRYESIADINKTEMTCRIKKGEILMRSGDEPDRLRGLSIDDFYIDEARQLRNREVFDIMIGRIRESEDAQWHISTTTRGRDWVHDIIRDAGLLDQINVSSYARNDDLTVIRQSTLDAVEYGFIPSAYYNELKNSYTTEFSRQELEADFVDFSGEAIKPEWFNHVRASMPTRGVRGWDIAVTIKNSNDYSAGALLSTHNGHWILHDMSHGRWDYPQLRRKIIECAQRDGKSVIIAIEEAGQQRAIIDDIRSLPELAGYTIRAIKPHGDKAARANPWISRAQLGAFDVCAGSWVNNFLYECASFTLDGKSINDDQIDAVSIAYAALTNQGQTARIRLY